ncbi:MAG: MFS transporter [Ignavibacteria bacterium]|nr:MFS transporter [Ignavibacteria bacterium]
MKITERNSTRLLLAIQFLERFAYTNVLVQLPIYISQKGIENTLAWGQELKGWIFFVWALIQNLTPVFLGVLADRISPKKTIYLSLIFVSIGYLFLVFSNSFTLILLSVVLIGFGSGGFKPSIQSLLSQSNKKIWAKYLFVNNFAFLCALIFSSYIKNFDWKFVFISSFLICLSNVLISMIVYLKTKSNTYKTDEQFKSFEKVRFSEILNILKEKKILLIIGFTSCFAIIYMQFYETFPNFIVDWVDTSSVAQTLHFPENLTISTDQGKQISYELLYLINPILILLFVATLQKITERTNVLNIILLSLFLVSFGFAICGSTRNGLIFISGIFVYTLGEMLFNIKILEIIAKVSPIDKRATYYGIINISYTIGLTSGALSGGYFYKEFAEKFSLANRYIQENLFLKFSNEPYEIIKNLLKTENVTQFLWTFYKPYYFWTPYIIIGFFGILLALICKKYKLD